MKPFTHRNARSITEATRLLAAHEGKAKVNAGGMEFSVKAAPAAPNDVFKKFLRRILRLPVNSSIRHMLASRT